MLNFFRCFLLKVWARTCIAELSADAFVEIVVRIYIRVDKTRICERERICGSQGEN